MSRLLKLTPLQRCLTYSTPGNVIAQQRRSSAIFRQIRYINCQQRRLIHIPTVLLPPVVFAGLVVALWTWKCCMMIMFQNKIIYMPGLPPNARRETIADYKNQCVGIEWKEERIKSLDGTRISLCIASVESATISPVSGKLVCILYFQGNASSLPPRLPFLSPVLRILRQRAVATDLHVRYTMICCSYRGYWTSSGRATERGIAMDAVAALQYIRSHAKAGDEDISVVVWGQSIGAGFAAKLASQRELFSKGISLHTLILETPFLSVRAMLETLYPQKWLPYRYLWPFLWNHLDTQAALEVMCETFGKKPPSVLILQAGRDELVPSSHGASLERTCKDLDVHVEQKVISGALHTEVLGRPEGVKAAVDAIHKAAESQIP